MRNIDKLKKEKYEKNKTFYFQLFSVFQYFRKKHQVSLFYYNGNFDFRGVNVIYKI